MNEELTPQKERFLREVEQKLLHRELDARLLEDGLVHVRWHEKPLCSVDRDGIVRFRPADITGPEVDRQLRTVIQTAGHVKEYMRIFERAPTLKVVGLDDTYKVLANFGDAVLAGLSMGEVGYRTYIFVAALFLVPATYLAFRIGWQGAAVALTAISILIAASSWVGGHGYATMEGQLFIATAGSVLLILGAAVDALRTSQDQVLQQNMALADGNARLNELSSQMQETARRNLSVSEDLRRWMATELHDELGQNLTALQVRIRLAERHPDKLGAFTDVEEIIDSMRRSVTGLLAELRPAGLDEFGLVRALRNGPIAELVASAGLEYRVRMSGDAGALECLDDDAQTALYRIVQEAATNTVRHAHASWFDVRLRSRHVPGGIRVVLVCANDGVGMPAVRRLGAMGLHGMDDRVRSFGGRLRIRSDGRGVRIVSDVTFPAVSVDGPSIA